MFTLIFWKAATERAVRAGANVVITSFVLGDKILDVFKVDWATAGGVFLGGMFVSYLMALASNGLTGDGPALLNNEKTVSD